MKVITHKYRETNDVVKYAVNLVDSVSDRPLKTYILSTKEESNERAKDLAKEHNVKDILNNSGFSIVE
jgi:RPA family protein|tara:strand:- start:12094 stop:12297 length:204 start_codon:yes stop_codon:yes gene_type:complete